MIILTEAFVSGVRACIAALGFCATGICVFALIGMIAKAVERVAAKDDTNDK